MANHKSAAKRARQDIKKTEVNARTRKTVRTFEKKLRNAIATSDKEAASSLFIQYTSKLDKAAAKGVVHRNTASRKTARLSKQVAAL